MEYLLLAIFGFYALDVFMEFRRARARWREIASGRAGISTLRLATGLWDREELSRRFGPPDPTYQYAVTTEQVRDARTPARRLFDKAWIERTLLGAAVIGGGLGILLESVYVGMPMALGAVFYHVLASGHSLLVHLRSYRQALVEGRAKFEYLRGQQS